MSNKYYGGIYDKYAINIGIAPQSKVNNSKEWFVNTYIAKGKQAQNPITLQK